MYSRGYVLKSDADFDNAIFFEWDIEVYQQGEPLDPGGKIQSYSKETVKISGDYYLKSNCDFKIRNIKKVL